MAHSTVHNTRELERFDLLILFCWVLDPLFGCGHQDEKSCARGAFQRGSEAKKKGKNSESEIGLGWRSQKGNTGRKRRRGGRNVIEAREARIRLQESSSFQGSSEIFFCQIRNCSLPFLLSIDIIE